MRTGLGADGAHGHRALTGAREEAPAYIIFHTTSEQAHTTPGITDASCALTRAVRVRFVPALVVWLTLLPPLSPIAFAQHQFESWTTENGLPQNSVNDIVQTRDGYLWLATFGGLVRFDGIRFVIFDRSTPGSRASA